MNGWSQESLFASFIFPFLSDTSQTPRAHPSHQERQNILSTILSSLNRLRPFLIGHEAESYWIDQLFAYVEILTTLPPAQTAVEQFDQLYKLRKWVLFVPSLLLELPVANAPATLVLAHLYATAIALEPLFPNLGPSFCAAASLDPLERIIHMNAPMQLNQNYGQHAREIGNLMHFPQQAASLYRWTQTQQRNEHVQMHESSRPNSYSDLINLDSESMNYTSFGNLSPGFIPSQLNPPRHSEVSSESQSPYLEVPPLAGQTYENAVFGGATSEWGTSPSPGFPAQRYIVPNEQQEYDCDLDAHHGGFRGGFVNVPTIWT